jgi:transmembrane E3 ubiquitin-protein ligase
MLSPKWVTAKVYDYHPAIPFPDAEAPKQSLGDCAICMEHIVVHPDFPVNTVNGTTSSPLLSSTAVGLRRVYALAPCHHIFVSLPPIVWIWVTKSTCSIHNV